MRLLCKLFGHKWQLETYVATSPYPVHCRYRCKRCQTVKIRHDWKSVEGRCYDQCSLCGNIRNFDHNYKDGKCVRCGELAPQPRQKKSYEESMTNADEGIGSSGVRGGW